MPMDLKEFVAKEKGWDPKCLKVTGIELDNARPDVVTIKMTYRPALKAARLRFTYVVDKDHYKKISGRKKCQATGCTMPKAK